MAAKHLTRREIKEEGVFEYGLTSASEWAIRNWTVLAIGLGGVALAIVVGLSWSAYQGSQQAALQARFGAALDTYHGTVAPPVGEEADSADPENPAAAPAPAVNADFATDAERAEQALQQFSELAEAHPGSRLGDFSRYYVALSHRDLGNTSASVEGLESIIETTPHSDIRNLARQALAPIHSSSGDHLKAAGLLEAILAEEPPNFPVRMTVMTMAREYEAGGNLTAAVTAYRRIVNEFQVTEDARLAQSKIDQLEPRLAGAEAAPTPPPDTGS